ncbi:acetyl-CoA carboxylase [Rhizobium sp. CECT 9324]|uniref:acetyl-CoA carboxylase n=1 Tax=Rhizobium sp. CECT 9324 TaxID=2845820 RepID=UPI001E58A5A2|nr:acetyl-CoA carboxylase [Rhizobium sp. CECT 9324]CAH0343375.1 hypothetical protein RHI9324_05109 [Rhizobium sp. CECT 9324]
MSAIDFSDPKTIAFLTDALTAAGVGGIEISAASGSLRLMIAPDGEVRPTVVATAPAFIVKAPMAGVVCFSHVRISGTSTELPRLISGTEVLGFLRIGLVLLPLTAGRAGLLTKLRVEANALVGFGDALFEIEPQS